MRAAKLDPIEDASNLFLASEPIITGGREFARHLAQKGLLGKEMLSRFHPASPSPERKKLRELWQLTDLSANDFADEVARFYRLPRVRLTQLLTYTSVCPRFSGRFLRQMTVFPCKAHEEGAYKLVVADPSDIAAMRAAEIVLDAPVAIEVASFEDITTLLSDCPGSESSSGQDAEEAPTVRSDEDIENLRDLASGAPVVRAVNDLLEKALELRATDIHIEPLHDGVVLRMRIDGLLRVMPTPSDVLPQALISRVKILSGLDIAERRLPQDGAAHLRIARSNVDVRVATMPTQHGEGAVIRLLPKDRGVLETSKLGLSPTDEDKFNRLLTLPHGLIVVTGPTGSGKTTTLATMLTALNDTTRKILTIEDPVEYEIRGINQSQVKPSIGLTVASALRAFVRQDPDVIMVGEIRDPETAHIAIHAALTGHLVLTTLHTETAAAAVPRLLDLGAESFLLQSSLRAIIAQRLVRILCERCKAQRRLTAAAVAADPRYRLLGLKAGESVGEPRGCDHCGGTGYRGRTGIFEVLEATEEVRDLIAARTPAAHIGRAAQAAGMRTMFCHGVEKCRAGVTSTAEVLRVTTAS
jgi:general secretion pathway protein E